MRVLRNGVQTFFYKFPKKNPRNLVYTKFGLSGTALIPSKPDREDVIVFMRLDAFITWLLARLKMQSHLVVTLIFEMFTAPGEFF